MRRSQRLELESYGKVGRALFRDKCGVRRAEGGRIPPKASYHRNYIDFSAMSPHKIQALPSIAALPQYGISKNGFLPAGAPLNRLPQDYYQPWESIIDELPVLIEVQQIRQRVDRLPVLSTCHLCSEQEWQRAHSILAVIAQGYIWTGPLPSEVSPLPEDRGYQNHNC